jgi:hypothetical protein
MNVCTRLFLVKYSVGFFSLYMFWSLGRDNVSHRRHTFGQRLPKKVGGGTTLVIIT